MSSRLDERVVFAAQQILEQDLHRVRQPRDAGEPGLLERGQAVDLDVPVAPPSLSSVRVLKLFTVDMSTNPSEKRQSDVQGLGTRGWGLGVLDRVQGFAPDDDSQNRLRRPAAGAGTAELLAHRARPARIRSTRAASVSIETASPATVAGVKAS